MRRVRYIDRGKCKHRAHRHLFVDHVVGGALICGPRAARDGDLRFVVGAWLPTVRPQGVNERLREALVGLPAVDAVVQVRIEPLRPRLAAEGRQDHVGQIDRGEDVERTCGTHLGRVGVAVAGKVLEGEESKRVNGQKRRKA